MLTKTLSEFKKVAKEKKINIKRVEEDGTSLLHWFCSSGKQDIVHYLLSSGVPITKNKTNGQSPLHCAVDCNDQMEDENRANIVQDLVHTEGTGDVDQEDINKWTPLKLACRSGLYQCVSYLLSHCADAEKQDREGNTALHDAVPYPNVTHLVISYVDDLNMKNSDHDTPLILAVKSECEQSVSLLARAGADVNKENAYGRQEP
jgi:ankyrin repeat protein